ncbi:MAG: Rab family GTPase [Nannocystaceae bacterium]
MSTRTFAVCVFSSCRRERSMLQKKICLLGTYAVGKTSLVSRFVHSMFSSKYHTTVGVKVDKKVIQLADKPVKFMIWDVQGEDDGYRINPNYLRGAAGFVLVADCSRPETLESLDLLNIRVRATLGSVPCVIAINKIDLLDGQQLQTKALDNSSLAGVEHFPTSAKTGHRVDEMLHRLAHLVCAS